MNKAIDAAAVVANEKCDLFAQIDLQLRSSKILSNSDVNISFEDNPIIKKPEAALAKAFSSVNEAVNYFLKNLNVALNISGN